MKKYEQWNIRLLGPLGRALDHFCSCHLVHVDLDALLLPFKEKTGPRCGTDSLLWGEVVNTGVIANHFVSNSVLDSKLRKAVSDMVALQESGETVNGCSSPSHAFTYLRQARVLPMAMKSKQPMVLLPVA